LITLLKRAVFCPTWREVLLLRGGEGGERR